MNLLGETEMNEKNKIIEFPEKPDEKTGLLLPKGSRKEPIGFARGLKNFNA